MPTISIKYANVVFETTRLLLILLFTYTAVSKLIGHYLFLQQLRNNPVLQWMAVFLSIAVPLLELAAALCLLFIKTGNTGWWISGILMSSFTIYIAAMLWFSPKLPCSCGGIIDALSWKQHLIINGLLSMLCWMKLYQHHYVHKINILTGSKPKTL